MQILRHLPNVLSYSRAALIFIVLIGVMKLSVISFAILALVSLIYAALSDYLDGFLARKLNVVSEMGKIIDPIADKCVLLGVFASYFVLSVMPFWIFFLIVLREVAITVVRLFWAHQGKIVAAEWSGKVKTFVQFIYAIAVSLFLYTQGTEGASTNPLPISLMYATLALTLYSGGEFVLRNRSVK